jgi:signal transduction histidine kinase/DNA-binding response OmpR family regulator
MLKDSTGELTIDDVSSDLYQDKFYTDSLEEFYNYDLDLGPDVRAIWIKFTIRSTLDIHLSWLLSFSTGIVEGYIPADTGGFIIYYSGINLPLKERYYKDKYGNFSLLPLEIKPGSIQTIYLKLQHFNSSIFNYEFAEFNARMFAPEVLTASNFRFRISYGVMFGMMIAVAFYHLLIYFFNWRRVYLLFSLFVLVEALDLFGFTGFLFEYFLPEFPKFVMSCIFFFGNHGLYALFLYLFSRDFLELKKFFRLGDWIWGALTMFILLLKIWMLIIIIGSPDLPNSPVFANSVQGNLFSQRNLHLLVSLIAILMPIVCIIRGNKRAILYLIGLLVLFYQRAAEVLAYYYFDGLPFLNPPDLGKILAVLIFAIGIAQMIRALEKDKIQAEQSQAVLLAETNKMKELDTFKTHFYTNVTHEFRTPLTVILGMVDQIRQKPSEWYEKGLELIQRNGKKLLKLTNQMLYLSKLEARVLPVNKIQGDICLYLNFLVESFDSIAEIKQIDLSFNCLTSPILMDYDPDKIQEIVSNLLSNALKFTPEKGSVVLSIEQVTIDGNDFFQLVVEDTGTGINSNILPHVFDRYFTVESPSGPKTEGTGLGLSLTKEVVRLLNGKIHTESIVGKGSTFTVQLPITRETEEKDWQQVHSTDEKIEPTNKHESDYPGKSHDIQPSGKHPLLVLVVEDNHDVIEYLNSLFLESYHVETAENGKEGLKKAQQLIPDLVISDVMMPVMDGFEFCSKLKTDLRTSHIPVILLTAKADSESRLEGLSQGADAYLTKPFNQQELFIRIRKLIELRQKLQARYNALDTRTMPLDENESIEFKNENIFINRVRQSIIDHLDDENFGIEALCKDLTMSRSALYRKFSALTDITLHQFVLSIRLKRAKELLLNSSMNISKIALETGFKSVSNFSRTYSKKYGESPSKTRK